MNHMTQLTDYSSGASQHAYMEWAGGGMCRLRRNGCSAVAFFDDDDILNLG
jgi:hypothetical protein